MYQELCRTSRKRPNSWNSSITRSSHLRPASSFLNDQGNCMRRPPSLPASARTAMPRLNSSASAGVQSSSRWWVKRWWSLAVKRKSFLSAVRRTQDWAMFGYAGR